MYVEYIIKGYRLIFHTHKVMVSDVLVPTVPFTSATVAGFHYVINKHVVFTRLVVVKC